MEDEQIDARPIEATLAFLNVPISVLSVYRNGDTVIVERMPVLRIKFVGIGFISGMIGVARSLMKNRIPD